MLKPNLKLLKELREDFVNLPEEMFDMDCVGCTRASCGSAFCIAGRILIISGWQFFNNPPGWCTPEGEPCNSRLLEKATDLIGMPEFNASGYGPIGGLFIDFNLATTEDVIKKLDKLIIKYSALEAAENAATPQKETNNAR